MPKNPRKPGRPAFKPTDALRRRVSVAAGGGMRHEDIAIALGISRETLRKYFETELSVGANARRVEVLAALHRAATGRKSSVSAARAYLALEPELAAPPAEGEGQPAPPAAPPVPGTKRGKKEQAQADAVTAQVGTEWDDLLPTSTTRQ